MALGLVLLRRKLLYSVCYRELHRVPKHYYDSGFIWVEGASNEYELLTSFLQVYPHYGRS